jgi:hypothetical protein
MGEQSCCKCQAVANMCAISSTHLQQHWRVAWRAVPVPVCCMLLRILNAKGICDLVPSRLLLTLPVTLQGCGLLALQGHTVTTPCKQSRAANSRKLSRWWLH